MKTKLVTTLMLFTAVFTLSGFVTPAQAQQQQTVTTGQQQTEQGGASEVDPVWRGVQIFSLIAALVCLGLLIYGVILWRNGTQSNDILTAERGRNFTILFGILFGLFAIILTVTFLVIQAQQQQARQQDQQQIETSGSAGLQDQDSLLLIEAIPMGQAALRNVSIQLLFNQRVEKVNLSQSIEVVNTETDETVRGAWTVDGEYAIFRPSQTCPSPHTDRHCFAANQEYRVTISRELRSVDRDPFRCSLESSSSRCGYTFTTGEEIDAQDPSSTVTNPFDQQAVAVESSQQVEGKAEDDYAVVSLHFFVNGDRVGVAGAAGDSLRNRFRASIVWDTAGLEVESNNDVEVIAYDLAANTGQSSSVNVEVLPLHCFDNEQNEDEEGVDCGGPSCRLCQEASCTEDSECASSLCFQGVCREYPVIEEVIHADGAPGNIITIRGKNFGEQAGDVSFLGEAPDGDDVISPNPPCEGYWTDNEVTAVVPEGAVSGPLRIETAEGLFDTTDDGKGAQVVFSVNDVTRPGICGVEPTTQQIAENIQVLGTGFGDEQTEQANVLFGRFQAEEIANWSDALISGVVVPSMETGPLTLTLETEEQQSNPVRFTVEQSPTLPFIDSITPDRGPVGQIFSVLGQHFSDSATVRFINPRTGESTQADTELPDACQDYQPSNQRAYRVPRVEPGVYQVVIETDKGESNSVDFTVTSGGGLPGLCAMIADNGPLGTEVTLHGEGFGGTQNAVRFAQRIDDAEIVDWSNESVVAVVPPTAQAGPVRVIHENGNLSNALEFSVGTCSPDTCSSGRVCCASGSCQQAGTCSQNVPYCSYSWQFSTGDDLGGNPRVIESASCETNTQSPSPYRNTKDACLNGVISARFTQNMVDETLSAENVTVRRCNTGNELDASACETEVNISSVEIINADQPGEGFIAKPRLQLSPNTWYQVVLSTGFTAENELALLEPYRWSFKTQVGQGACDVDHVELTPPEATLPEIDATQDFSALPTALNCNILDPDQYAWSWLSEDTSEARVGNTDQPNNRALAVGPTEPGPPVNIYSEIPEQGVGDQSLLTIQLLPPEVVAQWPNCDSACVNASVGARFNQEMNETSVTSQTNVQLFRCDDEACSKPALQQVETSEIQYNNEDASIFFSPASNQFEPGAKYRVILQNFTSTSGLELGDLNYNNDNQPGLDSYSWIFTVRDQADLCQINSVDIVPPAAESSLIGEEFDYFSVPRSEPDACNENGQRLNAESYDWAWTSGDEQVATVSTMDEVDPEGVIDPYQLTTSEGPGETVIQSGAQGVTGEGEFTMTCGYESDSECPAPATVQSHGVGTNSCCYQRPEAVSVNPSEGSESVCTTLAVEVQFNQVMSQSSLLNNIILERDNGSQPCGQPEEETTAWQHIKGGARQLMSSVFPSARAQQQNWCEVPASVSTSENDTGTLATVYPEDELAQNGQYRVRAIGDNAIQDGESSGIQNEFEVSMSGDFTSTFSTGEATCSLEVIDVTIDPPGESGRKDIFSCAVRNDCDGDTNQTAEGNQHTYTATGRDSRGHSVPADFTWATDSGERISLNTTEGESVEVTSSADNGSAAVTVFGEARAPSDGEVSKTVSIRVFLCENPWPSITEFPYTNIDFNYDTFYCRDFGEPGEQDDLPPLSSPLITDDMSEYLEESLFIVE